MVYRRFDSLWWVDANGSGRTGAVPNTALADIPVAVAPDGDTLAVLRTTPETGGDIYSVSLSGAWQPRPLVRTGGYDGGADFSADGHWMVYASTDSGPSQVYLVPFPAVDRKWSVSTRGGTQPRWSRPGKEIFYRDGNRMMVVDVGVSGQDVRLSTPRVLFDQQYTAGAYVTIANYDVTADGRFIMVEAERSEPRLTVVLNWFEELKRRVK